MTYFISEVMAQEAAPAAASANEFSFTSFIPLILIFVIFYFLILRPQSKKIKEHQLMVNNLKVGDKVVTNGGIMGVVSSINDKENIVEVEIASNTKIKILKNYILELEKKEEKNSKK